ncbi:MAG: type IV secretory system conjugative DNA transfer family protein [Saccharofermentans sp.]|nr:type IV secretory system conjugative DNA transfer family protein [Saccharofermentans sp.]
MKYDDYRNRTMTGISGNKAVRFGDVHKPAKPVRVVGKGLKLVADERSISNLNALVIGGTGAGKTRGYVSPNISQASNESMVIIDSKLNLFKRHKEELESKGYIVELIDLVKLGNSTIGYNPLDFVRYPEGRNTAKLDDIREIAGFILPDDDFRDQGDPFWSCSAKQLVTACLALCFHILPEEERNFLTVSKLLRLLSKPEWDRLIHEACIDDPDCFEVQYDKEIQNIKTAEKMCASIIGIATTGMGQFTWDDADMLYCNTRRINFSDLGEHKTALFINSPDHCYEKTPIVRIFFAQCIKELLDYADSRSNSRLKIPVHLYCDDIGANFVIPHLPELLSITRSRGVSVSLILQSWSQLVEKYGLSGASTVAGNCSIVMCLGTSDNETPDFFAKRANLLPESISGMPIDTELLCIQGKKPFFTKKTIADDLKPVVLIREDEEEPSDPFKEVG